MKRKRLIIGGLLTVVLLAGSLDRIGTNSVVSAWGERHGDRLIATVVLYTPVEIIPVPDHSPDQ